MSVIEIEREAPAIMSPCEVATLAWVNRVREKYNIGPELEMLPVGFPSISTECPVAHALHGQAGYHDTVLHHWSADEYETLPTPVYVREFMKQFDAGQIEYLLDPEYIALRDGPCES